MTTKVIVVCPDHSLYDVIVNVETDDDNGWKHVEQHVVKPTEQSEPIYIDGSMRLVVSETDRAEVAPRAGQKE